MAGSIWKKLGLISAKRRRGQLTGSAGDVAAWDWSDLVSRGALCCRPVTVDHVRGSRWTEGGRNRDGRRTVTTSPEFHGKTSRGLDLLRGRH